MAIPEGKRRVVATITNEEYEQIEQIAKEQDRSISYIVTKLIRKGLNATNIPESVE